MKSFQVGLIYLFHVVEYSAFTFSIWHILSSFFTRKYQYIFPGNLFVGSFVPLIDLLLFPWGECSIGYTYHKNKATSQHTHTQTYTHTSLKSKGNVLNSHYITLESVITRMHAACTVQTYWTHGCVWIRHVIRGLLMIYTVFIIVMWWVSFDVFRVELLEWYH